MRAPFRTLGPQARASRLTATRTPRQVSKYDITLRRNVGAKRKPGRRNRGPPLDTQSSEAAAEGACDDGHQFMDAAVDDESNVAAQRHRAQTAHVLHQECQQNECGCQKPTPSPTAIIAAPLMQKVEVRKGPLGHQYPRKACPRLFPREQNQLARAHAWRIAWTAGGCKTSAIR